MRQGEEDIFMLKNSISYVSLPRLLDTRRLDSPPQASVDPLAQRAMKISCEVRQSVRRLGIIPLFRE